ncbi:hypothetical protein [Actinoplanes sp. NPDC026619]|uniref:hypothetical protein n=1 Tax=Actinoplanes sp. NPDC026619 TaxID=3155798 RepID=UPI0033D1084E
MRTLIVGDIHGYENDDVRVVHGTAAKRDEAAVARKCPTPRRTIEPAATLGIDTPTF